MDKLNKSKRARYQRLNTQLKGIFKPTDIMMSRLATIEAILHHKIKYYAWTGIYLLVDGELLVHSYQGPVACQRLAKDKGVCWAAINQNKTLVIPDVNDFPGHIACNSATNSEIVVPLKNQEGHIIGVFDVDSFELNSFDEIDAEELEKIINMAFEL
ncbi:GAF domain-containing protein [Ancylomarina sp. 16SWW S1-10-2]|uniref:GAF domain-containing protein n=1 Tax=Ancylomarina sp. 16SWW S1-10-2 TaxID=2499681 RepID=UPI0012AE0BDA|nr:GAF domain-containing protein [Ancylomarina sp. 16SWW S1-10-2]MRT94242.1 GAF domain-containing protein [Ancylomarina sp. 16SWW S1-10-2]